MDWPTPSGYIYVGLSGLTASAVVPIHAEASVALGSITRMRVSNDGVHWKERLPASDFSWDLTDPAAGGSPADGLHLVYVQWATDDSAWGAVAGGSIQLDRTAPTSTVPTTALVPSAITTNGAPTVEVAWSGADGGAGVRHYEVARSKDGAAYVTIDAADPWPSITRAVAPGHTYRFRVRAIDSAGNAGRWSYGSTFGLVAISQSSSAVRYGGTWSTVSGPTWWGGTARSSGVKGSTVRLTFTGRSIAWIGLRGPTRGRAAVYVNGRLVSTVDLSFPQTRKQLTVWAANFATSARRTVTIKVLGTSDRPRVDVDGFIVRT